MRLGKFNPGRMAGAALLAQALLSSPSLFAEDCDQVIVRSDATTSHLEARGDNVRRCLDLANELARSTYRNTLPYCRNIALAEDTPRAINLPGQITVTPPTTETWEQFAMTLGNGAASAGCRDGIFSALQQTLFGNTERVRTLFVENEVFVVDELVGQYDISGPGGVGARLHISSTSLQENFSDVTNISAVGNGILLIQNSPFHMTVTAHGRVETFFGSTPIDFEVDVDGTVSGRLDSRRLEVSVNDYTANRVKLRGNLPFAPSIEALVLRALNDQKAEVAAIYSREATGQLKRAYQAADPFDFLASH